MAIGKNGFEGMLEIEQVKIKLGKRIEKLRLEKDMTQLELAKKIEGDRSNISRLENGEMNPKLEKLIKVAVALETTLGNLFHFNS